MKFLYKSQELWSLVENGLVEPEDQSALTQAQLTELKDDKKKDKKALFFIFQAVDEVIFERIFSANSAKESWDTLYAAYKGEDKIKLVRLQTLRCEFDSLKMKDSESVEEFFNRVIALVNQMKVNGEMMENQKIVEKILRSLTQKFEYIVVAIEESKDLSSLSLESFLGSLQSLELRMNQFDAPPLEHAFQSQVLSHGGSFRGRGRGRHSTRGRGRGKKQERRKDYEGEQGGFSTNRNESSSSRGRGRVRGRGQGRSLSQVQCYNCHNYGHTSRFCKKNIADGNKESNFMHKKDEDKDEGTVFLTCETKEDVMNEVWYLDSGCSNHMTGNKKCLLLWMILSKVK
ncbi:UBN2 domain-containing protein [Cephalotus follicularis]|uniref:UBN2 domain-containing protein n=1 Tax=Cephalotus follicularis TaxID=3775 RepID=A0A1Q3B1I6_CEPFO|nr:UBN2 domain-containing protein [Cephalotus follicularis]